MRQICWMVRTWPSEKASLPSYSPRSRRAYARSKRGCRLWCDFFRLLTWLERARCDTTYRCVNANTQACASSPRAEDERAALHDQTKADLLSLSCGRRSETAGAPCRRVSTSRSLGRPPAPRARARRAAHAPDKCPPSSSPQSRSKRLGTARGRADCKRRATRDSNLGMRHYTTPHHARRSMHLRACAEKLRLSRLQCTRRHAPSRKRDAHRVACDAKRDGGPL